MLEALIKQELLAQEIQRLGLDISEEERSIAFKALLPSLSLSSSYSRDIEDDTNAYSHTFTIDQPIFQGTALYNSWKIAKLQEEVTKNRAIRALEQLVLNVKKAWYDLIEAIELEAEAELSFVRGKEVGKISQIHFQEGTVPQTDPLQTEVRIAQSERHWIQANIQVKKKKAQLA